MKQSPINKKLRIHFSKIVLFVILFSSAIVWILSLPFWHIKEIIISGNSIVPQQQILDKAKVPLKENIFFMNYKEIKRRIKKIPQIKNASVSGRIPNYLVIKIEERKPFCVFIIGKKYLIADDEGYIINSDIDHKSIVHGPLSSNIPNASNLPVVLGLPKESIIDDKKISLFVMEAVQKSFKILSALLKKSKFEIEMKNADNINILIDDIFKIKLGNLENIDQKLKVISTLLKNPSAKDHNIEYIDVRVIENPAVKFR